MRKWPLALLLVAAVAFLPPASGVDADGDGLEDAEEQRLLETYAPQLYFHPQERYFPTTFQFALDHSLLERYNPGAPPILVDATPTAGELAAFNTPADPSANPGDIYYLNNTEGGVADDSGILGAYTSGNYAATAYGHVVVEAGNTVVQYWFYYPFNPAAWNRHEGDWEMVEVLLSGGAPVRVAYSQHHAGQQMPWADADLAGGHPKVYVALGSHASYAKPFQGTLGIAGDRVSDGGKVWAPGSYAVANLGEAGAPLAGMEWTGFAGRWGEFTLDGEFRGDAGPPGPAFREGGALFATPATWASELPVPDPNFLLVEWLFGNLLLIFVLILLAGFSLRLYLLVRVQKKTKAGFRLWPYAHLRPFDTKSAAMIVAVIGIGLGIAAALLPWFVVSVDANVPGSLVTGGARDLVRIDGVDGMTFDPLRPDGQVVRVTMLPLPIGIMLAITSGYFFFKIAGKKTSRRLGVSFLLKGIVALLPFILVLLISSLFFSSFGGDSGGQGGIDPSTFFGAVGASPFGGSQTVDTGNGGSVYVTWGLGIGAWLLLASAVTLFVAAGLAFSQRYSFLPQWYVDGFASAEAAAAARPGAVPAASASGGAPPPPPLVLVPPPPTPGPIAGTLAATPNTAARLALLQDFRDKGLVADDEFLARREEILREAAPGPPPMSPIAVAMAPGAGSIDVPPPATKSCGRCGSAVDPATRFCTACGNALF